MFYGCSKLTNVIISNGITTINKSAFSGCSNLTSISLPTTLTSIEDSAFLGCKKLSSIVLPTGVTNISKRAFYDCRGLSSIVIPKGVTHIKESTFNNCQALTNVIIPESVVEIEKGAFSSCPISIISIPESVTNISKSAFTSTNLPALKIAKITSPDSKNLSYKDFLLCVSLIANVESKGENPGDILDLASRFNGIGGTAYSIAVRRCILKNLETAKELGILGQDGGVDNKITTGEYKGEKAVPIEVLPVEVCPELKNQIFNLELLPRKVAFQRRKSEWIEQQGVDFAKVLNQEGLLSALAFERVKRLQYQGGAQSK
jgi:hypothetical protein